MATPSPVIPSRKSSLRRIFSSKRRKPVPSQSCEPIAEDVVIDVGPSSQTIPEPSVLSTEPSEHAATTAPIADDAEQASTTNTLTGTQNLTLSRSVRLGESRSIASDGDTSALTIVKPTSPSPRPPPFRLSKFFSKFFLCTSPSNAHPPDLDDSTPDLDSDIALREAPPPNDPQTDRPSPTPSPDSMPTSSGEIDIIILPPPSANLLPHSETDGVTSGAVQPPGSTGDEVTRKHTWDSSDDSQTTTTDDDADHGITMDIEDDEERLIRNGGVGIPIGPDGIPRPLLPPIAPHHLGRKCLVLDLDETLVHSSFRAVQHPDFVVPVEIESHWHHFHVLKRPGVDAFLKSVGEIYEVVVYTASLGKYADPVLDQLDIHQAVTHRLFRESCYSHKGNYVKDLSQLGRPIAETIIIDNSPASYIFHPNNAVPISSWFNDPHDTELVDLVPFLADLSTVDDVRGILDGSI